MYTVESLELALRGLYHFGIVDGNDQQTDDATEMDVLLEELDFDALLQTVRHNAQTPFCFMTCGKAAKSYAYRSEELFDQRATRLYQDFDQAHQSGDILVERYYELWLLEDMQHTIPPRAGGWRRVCHGVPGDQRRVRRSLGQRPAPGPGGTDQRSAGYVRALQ